METIGRKLLREHICVPWLIRHSTETVDRFAVAADGKTHYPRRKGKKFGGVMLDFGASIMF